MKYLLIIFFVLAGFEKIYSQTRKYDIRFANKSIGKLTVFEEQTIDDKKIYKIEATYSVPFHKGYFLVVNHYTKNKLTYSFYQQSVNDNPKDIIETKYANGHYLSVDSLKNKNINDKLRHPIEYTVCSFYYKEPKGQQKIFSERFGEYCEVSTPSQGTYEMKLPDGRVSTYIFRNGLCQEVRSQVMGGNLIFILE